MTRLERCLKNKELFFLLLTPNFILNIDKAFKITIFTILNIKNIHNKFKSFELKLCVSSSKLFKARIKTNFAEHFPKRRPDKFMLKSHV